jgi:hypothetical protein
MEELWCHKPEVLLTNSTVFWPTKNRTEIENTNSIVRFLLYGVALVYIYRGGDSNVIFVGASALVFLFILLRSTYSKNSSETFSESPQEDKNTSQGGQSECQRPTKHNPMSNYMYGSDSPFRKNACPIEHVENEIYDILSSVYDYSQYEDFNSKAQNRQFFSNPVTQAYNNQEEFAKWLYSPNVDRTNKM